MSIQISYNKAKEKSIICKSHERLMINHSLNMFLAPSVLLLFMIISIPSELNAQSHRFFYELTFKKDSSSSKYEKDYYILDISRNEQKFYNVELYKNDSIRKARNSDYIFSYPKYAIMLIQKKNDSFEDYFIETPQYYVQKSVDQQTWTIAADKKKTGNFTVQKATANFGGRSWIAWFAPDLPFFYGPYKFHGLPGLILEIEDSRQNFIFSFKGNQNLKTETDTRSFLETLNQQKPVEVSEKQRQKLKLDYYSNPFKDFKDGMLVQNDQGEMIKVNTKELTEKQQKYLKQYNNPIEADRAVQYP